MRQWVQVRIQASQADLSAESATAYIEDVRRLQGKIEAYREMAGLPKAMLAELEKEAKKRGR